MELQVILMMFCVSQTTKNGLWLIFKVNQTQENKEVIQKLSYFAEHVSVETSRELMAIPNTVTTTSVITIRPI